MAERQLLCTSGHEQTAVYLFVLSSYCLMAGTGLGESWGFHLSTQYGKQQNESGSQVVGRFPFPCQSRKLTTVPSVYCICSCAR